MPPEPAASRPAAGPCSGAPFKPRASLPSFSARQRIAPRRDPVLEVTS